MLPWFIIEGLIFLLQQVVYDYEAVFLRDYKAALKKVVQHVSFKFMNYFGFLSRLQGVLIKLFWALPWLEENGIPDYFIYSDW